MPIKPHTTDYGLLRHTQQTRRIATDDCFAFVGGQIRHAFDHLHRLGVTHIRRAITAHHHAVGADHRPWMTAEIGDLGVAVLRAVKQTLDPAGILNPGKLIP